ncbi:MAG: DNA alkylation repair protein [Eubacterium sp.]|nr:DNA alkylation repair protein [Eubacterium sp.]
MDIIKEKLFELQDFDYRKFHAKLMPNIDRETIIGVRTPALRKLAKEIVNEDYISEFLSELPHQYYEENNLHSALINLKYKKLEELLPQVERFLPYINNWATCDMMSPKAFKKDPELVYQYVKKWLKSKETYTVRFGIVTLLGFYLDEGFQEEMLKLVAGIKSEEYYINMAIAWYFSIALVKQYEVTLPYIEKQTLDVWTHNKAIQKAIESRRISVERKNYLRNLKVK